MSDTRHVDIVELMPAYMWDCPSCGRENFQRSITIRIPFDDEDLPEEMRGQLLMTAPDRVACKHCGSEFPCYQDGEEIDGDEEEDDDE